MYTETCNKALNMSSSEKSRRRFRTFENIQNHFRDVWAPWGPIRALGSHGAPYFTHKGPMGPPHGAPIFLASTFHLPKIYFYLKSNKKLKIPITLYLISYTLYLLPYTILFLAIHFHFQLQTFIFSYKLSFLAIYFHFQL